MLVLVCKLSEAPWNPESYCSDAVRSLRTTRFWHEAAPNLNSRILGSSCHTFYVHHASNREYKVQWTQYIESHSWKGRPMASRH